MFPIVAKPKEGIQDEFHIVQESSLKHTKNVICGWEGFTIPGNFDMEILTPRHLIVKILTFGCLGWLSQ